MKRSLFSPLNILIVALIAGAVWFYMKHMHKNEEAAVATEQVAIVVEEEPTTAAEEVAPEAEEAK